MSITDVEATCPSCGTAGSSRFCGHCGALVRSRRAAAGPAPHPEVPLAPPAAPPAATVPEARGEDPDADHDADPPPVAGTTGRRRAAVAVVLTGLLALVASAVLGPRPEVVTADGAAGPDGSGRTSTHAVGEGISTRWDTAWQGPSPRTPLLAGATDLGRVFVVATGTETIGLMHPEGIAAGATARDGVNLGGTLDPVLWRLPAIDGTPVLVGDRLPVLADHELLWLSPRDGSILERHPVTEATLGWAPAFAVPAGELLVAPDGSGVLTRAGELGWRTDATGEVVGVTAGTVVVQQGRELTGRALDDGAVRWTVGIADEGHVSAALVDGVVVATSRGGRLRVIDPATGTVTADRSGPVPANARRTDGETSIVGTTATDVFVRVHASYGIRYVRVSARDATTVESLGTLADRDVRSIQEHDGDLLTLLWDGVEVRRHGAVGWAIAVLRRPPAAATGWVVFGEGEFTITSTDGLPTSIRVPHAPVLPRARPAVLDGHAVLRTPDGLEARDLATGERSWLVDVEGATCCPSHLVAATGIALADPEPRVVDPDGEERWRRTAPAVPADEATAVTAIVGDWVVVGGDAPGAPTLRALADGRPGPTLDVDRLRAVVSDGALFHGLAADPSGDTVVVAYDVPAADASGSLSARWRVPVGRHVQLVRTGDELLVVGAADVLHLDPATGVVRRRTVLPAVGTSPAAVADGRLVRRIDAHTVEGVELATGDRWTRRFEQPVATAPTVAGDVVYVGDAAAVVWGLSLADGAAVTSVSVPGMSATTLTVAEGYLLAGGPDRLHVLGPEPAGTTAAAPASDLSSPAGRRAR